MTDIVLSLYKLRWCTGLHIYAT